LREFTSGSKRTKWSNTTGIDNRLTHGGEVGSFTLLLSSTPQKYFLVPISVRSGTIHSAMVCWLEELGKLKNSNDLGTRTQDLLPWSIVPQLTTLPHAKKFDLR
jgi:hypothetical protein